MAKNKKSQLKNTGVIPTNSSPPPDTQSHTIAQLVSRSAPLPHPSELEGYEHILPGAAERIFAMAESQSSHRQELEVKAFSTENRNSLLGILAAWSIGIFGLSVAGYCVYSGHDVAGGALGGTTLVSLVSTFIYGTHQRKIEREQKYQIMKSKN